MPTLHQRADEILAKVVRDESSCWTYPTCRRAYLTVDGVQTLVYRILYEATNGPIPRGENVLHTCDNGNCCNPEHLELGGQRANLYQALARGRVPSQSPLPGVSWQGTRRRWLVMPRIDGEKICLYAGPDFFEAACRLRSWQNTQGEQA